MINGLSFYLRNIKATAEYVSVIFMKTLHISDRMDLIKYFTGVV